MYGLSYLWIQLDHRLCLQPLAFRDEHVRVSRILWAFELVATATSRLAPWGNCTPNQAVRISITAIAIPYSSFAQLHFLEVKGERRAVLIFCRSLAACEIFTLDEYQVPGMPIMAIATSLSDFADIVVIVTVFVIRWKIVISGFMIKFVKQFTIWCQI